MHAKDPYEAKYQLLINKRESASIKHFNESIAFFKYSSDMDDINKNIYKYNPNEKWKWLIDFDDTIADMLSNRNRSLIQWKLY